MMLVMCLLRCVWLVECAVMFFFKQKTAYEMRISDWSSDVCSSDLYLKDKKRVLPCAAYLSGEYGVNDLYVGVPVVIGAGGVEKVVEIKLGDEAKENFQRSVDAVKELLVACKGIDNSLA